MLVSAKDNPYGGTLLGATEFSAPRATGPVFTDSSSVGSAVIPALERHHESAMNAMGKPLLPSE